MSMLQKFLFDLFDLLTFGYLARRFARRLLVFGHLRSSQDGDGMKLHLFTSRILLRGDYRKELDAFQEICNDPKIEWNDIRFCIEKFWDTFPDDTNFWRKQLGCFHKTMPHRVT